MEGGGGASAPSLLVPSLHRESTGFLVVKEQVFNLQSVIRCPSTKHWRDVTSSSSVQLNVRPK